MLFSRSHPMHVVALLDQLSDPQKEFQVRCITFVERVTFALVVGVIVTPIAFMWLNQDQVWASMNQLLATTQQPIQTVLNMLHIGSK